MVVLRLNINKTEKPFSHNPRANLDFLTGLQISRRYLYYLFNAQNIF